MIDDSIIELGILTALAELGGGARRKEVLGAIERRFGALLELDDTRRRPSGRDVVWKNRASFVRNALVDQGLLQPTRCSGWGVWALTARGEARAATLASEVVLCPAFRSIAIDVAGRMRDGHSVGLVPGETTFTDNALLHLAVNFRASIRIQRFTVNQEASNGADWEWWIRERHGYVGFRVQAKRVHPHLGRVALDQPAAKGVRSRFPRQIDAFSENCRRDRIAGLYCMYNDARLATSGLVLAPPGPCPHGPDNADLWGCSLVLVDTAMRLANDRALDASTVLGAGIPWHRLVCRSTRRTLTASVFDAFSQMRAAELALRRRVRERRGERMANHPSEPELGPAPAVEPPEEVLEAFIQGHGFVEHSRSEDLAGLVLIDATRAADLAARQ
ncbi:winged helix-turn-helix domain-containing protein [Micromonospora sp. C31]|uniref:winged helix-turn-helix domain-containing protein n=1 Tax=Micromonospora sp. C31 TaxID=2824876 RepID=UPI001B378C7C|nr:winged helix-turn-helix domain-containing protein [Micromonospora sp. C31]MBQ1076649.1 winged helix-turn-helix domain-containing protein [Micromonospora sp. C31]